MSKKKPVKTTKYNKEKDDGLLLSEMNEWIRET
jgi:hypothetical protein